MIVSSLAVTPSAVQTGESVTVTWHTENRGSGTAGRAFTERVRVVNTTNGRTLWDQTAAYDPAADGEIEPGAGRTCSHTVVVPDGSENVGALSVTVTTDQANSPSSTWALPPPRSPTGKTASICRSPRSSAATTSSWAPLQTSRRSIPARTTARRGLAELFLESPIWG